MTPYSNKPKITVTNLSQGYVIRYFVRNVSTKVITEVDKKQYDAFKQNPLFQTFELQWILTAFANDKTSVDGQTIYGTKHKNTITIEFYNKRYPGLNTILNNPLEYFQGVDNRTE